MNLENYLEQHKSINLEIDKLKELVKINNFDSYVDEIAQHINVLSGRLKIHLLNEDTYLYPKLKEAMDENIVNLAKEYQNEMGDLATIFTSFKEKYNTKSKLLLNQNYFINEFNSVIRKIESRIEKEESGIYKLIS